MLESGERSSIVKYGYTMIEFVFRQGQVYIYKPDRYTCSLVNLIAGGIIFRSFDIFENLNHFHAREHK